MYRRILFCLLITCMLASATFDFQCLNLRDIMYRNYDGSCNSILKPASGKAYGFYGRGPEGAEYADGISAPVTNRPSERVISNAIARNDNSENDVIPHSIFSTLFGQFIAHDLDNNAMVDSGNFSGSPYHIPVPDKDDEICWIQVSTTNATMYNACLPPFNQSNTINAKFSLGALKNNVFMVQNNATAWLDLSHVYGVSDEWNAILRTGAGGLLKTSSYNVTVTAANFRLTGLQPYNFLMDNGLPNYASTQSPLAATLFIPPLPANHQQLLFTAGDERVGENPGLSMFHTLFMREHNRLAAALAVTNPNWNDAQLFEEARRLNIAYYQNVVMYQYVPSAFGEAFFDKYIGEYDKYDCDDNDDDDDGIFETPTIFGAAAFRYGHSQLRNWVPRTACGVPTLLNQPANGQLLLNAGTVGGRNYPANMVAQCGGYENAIRGMISTVGEPMDVECAGVIRSTPFRVPVVGGTDILALDLGRGRMNGVPNYNTLRKNFYPKSSSSGHGSRSGNSGSSQQKNNLYGLSGCPANLERSTAIDPIGCFLQLTSNVTLANSLRTLYGKVNRIDGFIGLLIEAHVPDTSMGPTLGRLITENFANLRNRDRFWFENKLQLPAFSRNQLREIKETSMKDLIERNFAITGVPENPFFTAQFTC